MKKQKSDSNKNEKTGKSEFFELFSRPPISDKSPTPDSNNLQISARMARWFYDYNLNQTIWSDGVYEILELNPKTTDANYYTLLEVIHPEDRYRKINVHNELTKVSKPKELTYRLLMPDGRIKWINEICSTDFDQQGHPIRSFGTIQDISRYKFNEERLKDRDESLENIIDQYPSAILICRGIKIFFANQTSSKLLSAKSTRELIGKSVFEFVDGDSKTEFEKQFMRSDASVSPQVLETVMLRINGHQFDARVIIMPAKFKGLNVNQLVLNDITQQKRTEAGFRRLQRNYDELTENLNAFNWSIDLTGTITSISPVFEKRLGFRSGELTGLNIARFLSLESFALALRLIMRRKPRTASSDSPWQRKQIFEVISKTGTSKLVEITAKALYDDENLLIGFSGTGIDVSQKIKTEKKLKENELRLKELVAAKDKFFSIIAHDLRAPFNSMFGFLDLLESQYDDFTDSEKKTYIRLLNDNISQTFNLLENLLEWSKNQTGAQPFSPELHALKPIINHVTDNLNSSINYKNLFLNVTVPDNLQLFGDEHMLSTILHNLLTNAVKYSFDGGTISIGAEEKEGFVEITVADTGIGMDEMTRKSIFKPRETTSLPGTANEKGSGLGLLLCKEFVEIHGGKIWVKSELSRGSQFRFSIPGPNK